VLTAVDVMLPSARIKYSWASPLIVGIILLSCVRVYPYLQCFSHPSQWLGIFGVLSVVMVTPLGCVCVIYSTKV